MNPIKRLTTYMRWRNGIKWPWDQWVCVGVVLAILIGAALMAGCQTSIKGGVASTEQNRQIATTQASETTKTDKVEHETVNARRETTVERSAAGTPGETTTTIKADEFTLIIRKVDAATTQPSVSERSVTIVGKNSDSTDKSRSATTSTSKSDTKANSTNTHQPDLSSNTGQAFSMTKAGAGELAGISVEQAKANFPERWPLFFIIAGAAVASWYFPFNVRHKLIAIGLMPLALAVLLVPQVVANICVALVIGVLLYFAWINREKFKQLIAGNENALAVAPPELARLQKDKMEQAQSPSTAVEVKTVAKQIRAKKAAEQAVK